MGLSLFAVLLSAFALDNMVFTRALGLNRWAKIQDSPQKLLWYGAAYGWIALFSVLGNLAFLAVLGDHHYAGIIRAPGFLMITACVYAGTYLGLKTYLPKIFARVEYTLPVVTFNTALFGIFFIMVSRRYDGLQTMIYVLGAGTGYLLALFLLMYVRRRLILCPISKSFRGIPIMLIYIGLLSLALYGLLGYSGNA